MNRQVDEREGAATLYTSMEVNFFLYAWSLPPRIHEGAELHVTCMLLGNVAVPSVGENGILPGFHASIFLSARSFCWRASSMCVAD